MRKDGGGKGWEEEVRGGRDEIRKEGRYKVGGKGKEMVAGRKEGKGRKRKYK